MTRAVRRVTQWGFEELALNRIQATVMVGNTPSARVLEKCGFQREGTLLEYKICRGQPNDFWMFSQLHRNYSVTA
jgi:ribosomal-protein-alanine N-acetyltransferase